MYCEQFVSALDAFDDVNTYVVQFVFCKPVILCHYLKYGTSLWTTIGRVIDLLCRSWRQRQRICQSGQLAK